MDGRVVDPGSDHDCSTNIESSAEESDVEESESSDNYSDVDDDADLKDQLRCCLDDEQHEGSFWAFRHHKLYPNPGLFVKGLGSVGLPLSNREAKVIAALCKQSPFGRGDETVVDETVRKTWELDMSHIECRNTGWTTFERTLADQAVADMGVKASALAQPYKLLLYEEGAFFKAHRDTEKVPGMFGTMVICLPSEHTGGEVYLTHGGKQQTLLTAATSAYDLSTLAWYSDVQHEIKPILSGYRLVLTYNLVQDQTAPKQTAAAQDANHETLERLLRAWNHNFNYQDHFIYPLSFKYTENSLSQANLKGSDAAKGRYLDQVCVREGVYWFLAQMTKQNEEEDYYRYIQPDGNNDQHILKSICLPDGQPIDLGGLYSVDKDALLADQEILYGYRDPDSEDEGEYTGNENMPATHRYHDTVIILMRRYDVLFSFKIESSHSPASLFSYYSLLCADTVGASKYRRDALLVILEKAIGSLSMKNDGTSYPSSHILGYCKEEQELRRAKYAKVFETVADFCYLHGLSDLVSKVIRDAMNEKAWISSESLVGLVAKQVAFEAGSGRESAWNDWLTTVLPSPCTYAYANAQQGIYDVLRRLLPTTSISSFDGWKQARTEEIIRGVQSYSKDDAQAIVDLIPSVEPQTYFESIIPTLISSPDASGLSRLLYLLATSRVISQEHIVKPTYQRLARTAKAALKLPMAAITTTSPYPYDQPPETARPEEFLQIVECYLKLGLEKEGVQLLGAGLPELPDMDSDAWKHWDLLFGFLESIVTLLSQRSNPDLRKQTRPFICSLLHTLTKHFARCRPNASVDWSQSDGSRGYGSKNCSCGPCRALDAFLADPKERVGRFRYNESIRKHLRYELDSLDFKFNTEQGKSPYTLVITKTTNRRERELREWKGTISALRKKLEGLDVLLEPLGISATDAADVDAQLEAADVSKGKVQANQLLQPVAASSRETPTKKQRAGKKRKRDVVTLAED